MGSRRDPGAVLAVDAMTKPPVHADGHAASEPGAGLALGVHTSGMVEHPGMGRVSGTGGREREPARTRARRTRMRAVGLVVGLTLAVDACGTGPGTGRSDHEGRAEQPVVADAGSASCVGPFLASWSPEHPAKTAKPPPKTFEPGESVDVYGHWYTSTCNDTNHDNDPLVPLPDVTLTVTLPGGNPIHLGPFAPAGSDMGFHAHFTIPAGTPSGQGTVIDDSQPTNTWATYEFNVS